MTHHHDHEQPHHHEVKSDLTLKEKLIKLLDHWLKHNRDHTTTYKDWAQKAKDNDLPETGALMEEIHALSMQINDTLKKAADTLH